MAGLAPGKIADLKAKAQRAIDSADADLRSLSLDIHAHPELNFAERHAHDLLTDLFERRGFAVERGVYGITTAFRATVGRGAPTIAVLCEYDALPKIGHACGHNLIAASGVAAGLGLQAAWEEGRGTVLVLGTPAEEGGGGKIDLIERGAFAEVDAALMVHPGPVDCLRPNVLAIQQMHVEYYGQSAHAAAYPWEGVNALDALVLAYNGIAALRQQLPPEVRVHGIITQGGAKPNIIPDHTAADFYVRAPNDIALESLHERVLACFRGAAEATGCRLEATTVGKPYSNLTTNEPLAEAYLANLRTLHPAYREAAPMAVSTDMGNVSHVVPAIHPIFRIETEGGNHTPAFTTAAATPPAHAAMIGAATAMALTAIDLFTQPDLLAAVRQRFRADHGR